MPLELHTLVFLIRHDMSIIKLLRPHQYIKNGFVLLGVVFSHQWDILTLGSALLAFAAFCAIASAVYILNDLLDVEADRAHPVKRQRPLASGAVSLSLARKLFAALVIVASLLAIAVSVWVLLIVLAYLLLNIAYSLRLKHVVILDVFSISGGFMLRILAGTVGIGIAPSQWLLLCGLMITLFLGFAKRRAELGMLGSDASPSITRRVLDDYSPAMLDQFIAVSAACTVIAYSLYTVSPETIAMHGTHALIYTVPFVIYGIFRYLFLLHLRGQGNDTSRDLFTDPHLLLTVVGWLVSTVAILA
jgi:4-hydroxybenzoate polyprenyltransferase